MWSSRQWGPGPALKQRPALVRASTAEFEQEVEKVRAGTRYTSGELTKAIVTGPRLSYVCWASGRVLFDERGFAVVVGKSSSQWIPVAVVTPDPPMGMNAPGKEWLLLSSALEGSVLISELEKTTMRLIKVATRLVELRVGGWDIRPKQRAGANGNMWRFGPYNKQLSKFIHSANIFDPLTDQLAYRFPDLLPRKAHKQSEVLRLLMKELEGLPDSPILLLDPSANNNRLLALEEWSGDLENDSYERLALARYPQLPIKDIIAIAENARQSKSLDALTAIEAALLEHVPTVAAGSSHPGSPTGAI